MRDAIHTLTGQIPAANAQRNYALARRMANGDPEARGLMLLENLPLVKREMPQWTRDAPRSMTAEDLFSEALVILLGAIDRYDPERAAFSTYAVRAMRNTMYRRMDTYGHHGTIGRRDADGGRMYHQLCGAAKAMGVRQPTPEDINRLFDIDTPLAERYAMVTGMLAPLSMDAMREHLESEHWRDEPVDPTKTDEEAEAMINAEAVRKEIEFLPDPHKSVIEARFIERRSLKSVADELDMERIDVRKIEREALAIMRDAGHVDRMAA